MPNWCNNTFELVGPKEKIQEFEKFLNENDGKNWFDFFAPCPQELQDVGNVSLTTGSPDHEQLIEKYGYADWYSFAIGEWGCKWNCDANDWVVEDYDDKNLSINFWFDSPWGPPTELYQKIQNDELSVSAQWHEEGMAFVGKFEYGDVESYDYTDLDSLDDIPEELVENWNLREMLEDREEWDEDEEEDWDPKAELDEIVNEFEKNSKE
jgi:hypothetical protein